MASGSVRQELNPVMAEAGWVFFLCRTFEDSLCLLHALISEQEAPGAFRASWDFHSEKTLGQLLAALGRRVELPADFASFLRDGVNLRNDFIHGFMKSEGEMRVVTPDGRLAIINELRKLGTAIRARDIAICKLIDELLRTYGTSTADLKTNADRLWDFANVPAPHLGDDLH